MRAQLIFAAAWLLAVPASQARDFDLGTVELSGSGSYLSFGDDEVSQSFLVLRPGADFYLNRFWNAGPLISWERKTYEEKFEGLDGPETGALTSSTLGLGLKVGFLLNLPELPDFFRPFLDIGGGAELSVEKGTGTLGGVDTATGALRDIQDSKRGGLIVASAGIKFRLGESFLLSVFLGGSHHTLYTVKNQITAGFGFSGLIGWGGSAKANPKDRESPLGRLPRNSRS